MMFPCLSLSLFLKSGCSSSLPASKVLTIDKPIDLRVSSTPELRESSGDLGAFLP